MIWARGLKAFLTAGEIGSGRPHAEHQAIRRNTRRYMCTPPVVGLGGTIDHLEQGAFSPSGPFECD